MNVMLLAAGRSTRLGALGAELPKPLVPVCGHPVLRFGLAACARAGLREVVVNLHHRGEMIRDELGDGASAGVSVRYSPEEDLLGTGGGIAHARPLLGEGAVLVMNAKVVADVDLAAVVAAHRASGAVATMVLRADPEPRRWGAIAADEAGRVVGILDVRSPLTPAGASVEKMFTGIHVLEAALLDRLPAGVSDIIRDAYIPALTAGERINAFDMPGYFAEHSTPERYLAGNLALLRDPALAPTSPGPLTGVDPTASVDPSARVEAPSRVAARAVIEAGAVVGPDAVVCAGARVAAGARLRRAVVWPGAVASGDVENAVVTRAGTVPVAGTSQA